MPKLGETSSNFLKSLIGKTVKFNTLTKCTISGSLIAFDEFTIILKHPAVDGVTAMGSNSSTYEKRDESTRLYYKHAIESICEA